MLLPMVYLAIRALGSGSELWGLLLRVRTAVVLGRSVALAAAVTAASLTLAVPLAWLTIRADLPFRRFFSVLTMLPLVVPSYVGGFAFVAVLGPTGMLSQWLRPLGVERLPDISGFFGSWLVLTLFTYPYALLNIRASLGGMDPALEEASRSLGHGPMRTFLRVTLPQLRPALAAGALLVALYALSDFGAVSLMRFDSFTRVIYTQYHGSFDRTLAAGLALLLVALTLLILSLESVTRGGARYYRTTFGAARPQSPVSLGRWRWPALSFMGLVLFLALGVPLLVLLYWLAQGIANGEPVRLVWGAAFNAVYASGLAAVVAAAASLPVAFLAVRFPGRFASLVERSTYSGFALPGIVMALALVFFGVRFVPFLYQTLAMLVVAYVVRFLPEAVGTTKASLLQVSPSLEEAARSLGAGGTRALVSVTWPLIRPGVMAGAILVFLTAMKELPATLILSPTGFDTLATRTWSATSAGLFARAAVPALLLILVSSLPLALFIAFRRPVRS